METFTLCGKTQSMKIASAAGDEYQISNNAWNYARYAGEQCIQGTVGDPNFTVTRSLANSADVMGYPNVSRGPSPWANKSLNNLLPAPLSRLPAIYSSWQTSQNAAAGSKWDTTYDAWCCSRWPGPQYRTTEIMVMLTYPIARSGTAVLIDGEEFSARCVRRANPAGVSWNMVQFRFKYQRPSVASLNLTSFLRYAVDRGWANATDLLVQISAGFELWIGGRDWPLTGSPSKREYCGSIGVA